MERFFTSIGSGRLALLASALLGLLALWLVVQMVWLLVLGPRVPTVDMPPVPSVDRVASQADEFRWDLFGSAPTQFAAPAPVTRPSRSNLRLRGVFSGPAGYAIIADAEGREEVYRIGDELPGGGVVEEVEPNRVVVSRDGTRESIELDEGRRGGGRSGADEEASGSEPVEVATIPGLRGFDRSAGTSVASVAGRGSTGGIDASALAQQIQVMPVSGGGFRVRPGRDARLFAELGLQANDIVMAVNGRPLESEQAAQALFTEVMQRGEVAITINRQGREMTLRPDLEQILGSLQNQ